MFVSVLFGVSLCVTCYVGGDSVNTGQNSVHQDVHRADHLHPLFHCHDMSPSADVPTSVEFVKAADVKVIAALGDSLTTAIGANGATIFSIPFEYRHMSWSIGGHESVITLPNIFKLFNPELLGASPMMILHGSPTTISETGFNFAVSGHNTLSISEQGLNFEEDWKVVTMQIGMNDICDHCKNKMLFTTDNFIHHMTEALDLMMSEIPRTIVNVVQIFSLKALREIDKPTLGCYLQKLLKKTLSSSAAFKNVCPKLNIRTKLNKQSTVSSSTANV